MISVSDTAASVWSRIRGFSRFLRRHLMKTIAVLALLFVAWISYAVTRPTPPTYVTDTAKRGDLTQLVEAVGTVVSERDFALQFANLDVVASVSVKEGDTVKAGQRLAQLRSGALSAGVASASANVQSALASLRALEQGSRPEDIAVAEAQVANKRAALETAMQTLINAERDLAASTGSPSELATAASEISTQLAVASTALLTVRGIYNANDIQDAISKNRPVNYDGFVLNTQMTLDRISSEQAKGIPLDYQDMLSKLRSAREAIASGASVLNTAYDILSNLPLSSFFTQESKESNKSAIAAERAKVLAALSSIDGSINSRESRVRNLETTRDRAKNDVQTYETSLKIDEASLALKKAPARQTDIDSARARVNQARADLARAAAQLRDTMIVAPVDGVITQVSVKVGEIRPSAGPSITMLGATPLRIEVFVSEVDIPKVQLQQTGSIVLDAFPGTRFALRVSEIDPAATDKDGVPKYRIKLDFVYPHNELKVGMTGDSEIITGFSGDVVMVPVRAVVESEGKQVVRVMNENGEIEEREVTTGMEGDGGMIEVQGLEEGETVVVLEKK